MNIRANEMGNWRNAAEPENIHPMDGGEEMTAADPAEWMPAQDEPDSPRPSAGRIAAGILLALLALGWLGLVGWAALGGGGALLPLARDVALACVPLALIATLFVILRGGNALRFGGNAAIVEAQVRALDARLDGLGRRLASDRALLSGHARAIDEVGEETCTRLSNASAAIQADAALLARESRALEYAAAAARTDMAVLMDHMPRLEQDARTIGGALLDTGNHAAERIETLNQALATLAQKGREVDDAAGSAAERLTAHLARLDAKGEAASQRLDEAARQLTVAVDQALLHTAETLEKSRAGIDEQAAAMRALIEQTSAALDRSGAETGDAATRRLEELRALVDAIGERLTQQDADTRAMIEGLDAGIDRIKARFAELGESGTAEGARLSAAVQSIAGYAEQVREGLVVGGDAADVLIARATTLSEKLEAPARHLHETMPEAFARIEQQTRRSLATLNEVTPQVTRLQEITAALSAHVEASTGLIAEIDRQIAASTDHARALDGAIGEADASARRVAEGSVSALVEAMVRVRSTAAQAAERAREAIATVIPDSAAALADAGEKALADGVARAVEGQIARLHAMSEETTATAQRAADRLAGQMLQLSQTTAAVDQHIAAAQEKAEAAQLDSFPRRAAHLIDALNSAAIDVAKILSTEVTDTVWAAYLKGDRGVFTRRAVRLLEGGDTRDIARIYAEDPEFRDQVNRYVHDFEALLRPIMAGRDGAPLAVTLIGSDMGKLYVALAQAISRLRA